MDKKIVEKLLKQTDDIKLMFYVDLIDQVKFCFKPNFTRYRVKLMDNSNVLPIELLSTIKEAKNLSNILELIELVVVKDSNCPYDNKIFKEDNGLLFNIITKKYYIPLIIKEIISTRPIIKGVLSTDEDLKNSGIMKNNYNKYLNATKIILNIDHICSIN